MDRRYHRRIPADYEVRFSILGGDQAVYDGNLRDVSEGGVRIVVPVAVRPGWFIKLQIGDVQYYGEVRYCCPWMNRFVAGVTLEPSLVSEGDLASVVARALSEPVPKIAG